MKLASVKQTILATFGVPLESDPSGMVHSATIGRCVFSANTNAGDTNVLMLRVRKVDDHDAPEIEYVAGNYHQTLKRAIEELNNIAFLVPAMEVTEPEQEIVAEAEVVAEGEGIEWTEPSNFAPQPAEPVEEQTPAPAPRTRRARTPRPAPEPVTPTLATREPVQDLTLLRGQIPFVAPVFDQKDQTTFDNPKYASYWEKRRTRHEEDPTPKLMIPDALTLRLPDEAVLLSMGNLSFLKRMHENGGCLVQKDLDAHDDDHARWMWLHGLITYTRIDRKVNWVWNPARAVSLCPHLAVQLQAVAPELF